MNTFSVNHFVRIYIFINEKMEKDVGSVTHLGNNRFIIWVSNLGFMSGIAYEAIFWIDEATDKVMWKMVDGSFTMS